MSDPVGSGPPAGKAVPVQLNPTLVWGMAGVAALAGSMLPAPWWQVAIIAVAVAVCGAVGRIHAPALWFGLWGAVAFVALRLGYRVLFAPAIPPPPSAVVLLDLPVLALPAPFSGIALFGALTLEHVGATLIDASRFAVVFVVFGAANALADARTLLARAPRRVLPLATVLSLALGSVPALLTSARRVRQAARLRGERRGAHLLVPVFEQAVERATVLGASMELRGFGVEGIRCGVSGTPPLLVPSEARAPILPSPPQETLHAEGLTVCVPGPDGKPREVLRDVTLALRPGEVTIVRGATGSGKSTLLAALAGLVPSYTGGSATGRVMLTAGEATDAGAPIRTARIVAPGVASRPAIAAGRIALVPQRVEHSFVAEHVRGEIGFGLTRAGVAGEALEAEIAAALARFDLARLQHRELSTLSAGEATRVALAAASLTRPQVLLLDEPVADLDPDSVRSVESLLAEHVARGGAVLVAEHRPELLASLTQRTRTQTFVLAEGRLSPVPAGHVEAVSSNPGHVLREACAVEPGPAGDILLAQGLRVVRGGRLLLTIPELRLRPGEITVLTGPNGSGKTSLLEELERAHSGATLVPHRVDDLLIRDSIEAECRHADRRARVARGSTAARFAALISAPAVLPSPGTHPRDASAGTRLALGIAVQLVRRPRVLLLDEPTRGLDAVARQRLAALCADLARDGTGVLLTTHDRAFAGLLTQAGARVRNLRVTEGELA